MTIISYGLPQSNTHADVYHPLHCIMQLDVQANACLCHLCVLCSLDACLLAWHFKPAVMMMVSVQVCSESAGHAEAVEEKFEYDKLDVVLCWP